MRARIRSLAWAVALVLVLAVPVPAASEGGSQAMEVRMTPVVRAVKAVSPAVVNITTARVVERQVSPFGDDLGPLFQHFFGNQGGSQRRRFTQESLGSGVIIDGEKGLALTNSHVIAGATSISVRLQDGRTFEAELVGSNSDFDLAVLRLSRTGSLPAVRMGDSSDLMPGETVIAIGNPYGYNSTVTTGVISALNRSIQTEDSFLTDFIQTDAAINPGNSGGPLLNLNGELIGITTAIRADAQGIGFAIPINKAKKVVTELLSQGHVDPVWLGLLGRNIDQRLAAYLDYPRAKGMVVTDLYENSPAARAGVKAGDVVEEIGGVAVEDKEQFQSILRNYVAGDSVDLKLFREGQSLTLKAKAEALTPDMLAGLAWNRWGIEVVQGKGQAGSVRIGKVKPGSPAAKLTLAPGDRLVQIGGSDTRDQGGFLRAFARNMMQSTVILRVERGGRLYYAKMIL